MKKKRREFPNKDPQSDGEEKLLTELSMNSRSGIDKVAQHTNMSRGSVYKLIGKLIDKYDLHFVPEINPERIWKYEFIALTRRKSKREIYQTPVNRLGFESFAILAKFIGKVPSSEEILSAIGKSYLPQYIARLSGQYSLFIYAVARNPAEAGDFQRNFIDKLSRYNSIPRTKAIFPTFGFFPLTNALIEQMNIQVSYKRILQALTGGARRRFMEMGKEIGIDSQMIGFDYARMQDIGILTRSTLYIGKPNEPIIKLFMVSVRQREKFLKNRQRFLLDFIKKRVNTVIFMSSLIDPEGFLIIAKFNSPYEEEEFKRSIVRLNIGIKIFESTIIKTIYGHLGIRRFVPEETDQYKELESKGLVPKVQRTYRTLPRHSVDEEPDLLEGL